MASTASARARRRRSARQPGRVPLIAFEHAGKEPTEGLPDAVHGCAPQAPYIHNDPFTPAIERDVGHDPLIIRVHPARFDAADRTGHAPARTRIHPPGSVTSSMTSGDSPENTVLTS